MLDVSYVSDPSSDASAAPPSSDLDAALDNILGDKFSDDTIAETAAAPPESDAPDAIATEPAVEPVAPTPEPVLAPVAAKPLTPTEQAAIQRAEQAEAQIQEWQRAQAEQQEQAAWNQAINGAKAARQRARAEVKQVAEQIYDPEARAEWIAQQYDDIDTNWYAGELERLHAIREQRVIEQARNTIVYMGRAPFAHSLIHKPDSGLTPADLPLLLQAPDPSAKAQELKHQRKFAALEAEVKRLKTLEARGQLGAATRLPGAGQRTGGGFRFEKYDEEELSAGLDAFFK